jgi:hypothetical protein
MFSNAKIKALLVLTVDMSISKGKNMSNNAAPLLIAILLIQEHHSRLLLLLLFIIITAISEKTTTVISHILYSIQKGSIIFNITNPCSFIEPGINKSNTFKKVK